MAIAVVCTCGKTLRASDEQAGKKVKCPVCAAVLVVGGTPPAPSVLQAATPPKNTTADNPAPLVVRPPEPAPAAPASAPAPAAVAAPAAKPLPGKLRGHSEWVLCVACSPDGRYVLSGSSDKTARVWDLQSGKEIHTLKAEDSVYSVGFSQDGQRAFTIDYDVHVWNTSDWSEARRFPVNGYTFAFSKDGHRLLGVDRCTIELWDTQTGSQLLAIEGHPIGGHGSSLREKLEQLRLRLESSKTALIAGAPGIPGHVGTVRGLAFCPDGRHALSCSGEFSDNFAPVDCTMRMWNLASGREVQRFRGHASWVFCVDCSPDGTQAVTGGDDSMVRFWSLKRRLGNLLPPSAAPTQSLKRHQYQVNCVRFSPDGRRVASASTDSIRLWDVATHQELACFADPHKDGIEDLAFTPDGRQLLSASQDKTIGIWQLPA